MCYGGYGWCDCYHRVPYNPPPPPPYLGCWACHSPWCGCYHQAHGHNITPRDTMRFPAITFGSSQQVYLANASGKDVHVLAVEDPLWVIADVVADVALLAVGVTELKSVVMMAELPETIKTFSDLYKFLTIAAKLISGTVTAGSRPTEAANTLVNAFKKASIKIPYNEYKAAFDEGWLSTFLSPSGIAGMLAASTIALTVMSGDGKQVSQFKTRPDYSWIATSKQTIVRARYGSLWRQEPESGEEPWPVQ